MSRRAAISAERLIPRDFPHQLIPDAGDVASILSPDGRFVAFSGSNVPNADSTGVSVLSLADRAVTPWFTAFGEMGDVSWLKDGTLLVVFGDTPETYSLYHLLGPGRAEKLGAIPRRLSSVSVSKDLKRAAIVVRDYRGDAWMSKVVRR